MKKFEAITKKKPEEKKPAERPGQPQPKPAALILGEISLERVAELQRFLSGI
jgi:hypothetical protein